MAENIVRRWLSGLEAEVREKLMGLSDGVPTPDEVLSWDFAALGLELDQRPRLRAMLFFNAPEVDERYVRFMHAEYPQLQDAPVEGEAWELLPISEPLDDEHHAVAAIGSAIIAVNPADASAPVLLIDEEGARQLAAHFDDLVSHLKGS
jgi:hypothetical protein